MTLEESIKHYEEEAEKCERVCESIPFDSRVAYQEAKEYRQIAEWLKELRALRNGASRIFRLMQTDSARYVPNYDAYNLCLKLLMEDVEYTDIVMEVNADEVND